MKVFSHLVKVIRSITSETIFESCVSQRYKQKHERNCNNLVCTKIDNFTKSVNF